MGGIYRLVSASNKSTGKDCPKVRRPTEVEHKAGIWGMDIRAVSTRPVEYLQGRSRVHDDHGCQYGRGIKEHEDIGMHIKGMLIIGSCYSL